MLAVFVCVNAFTAAAEVSPLLNYFKYAVKKRMMSFFHKVSAVNEIITKRTVTRGL